MLHFSFERDFYPVLSSITTAKDSSMMKEMKFDISPATLREPFNTTVTVAIPVVAALYLHLHSQFREPHAHHFIVATATTLFGFVFALKSVWSISLGTAASQVIKMFTVFVSTLLTSIAIYRVLFHPLRHVPGPLWCKLSMWFWVPVDWIGSRHHIVQRLHQQYGDVVRIGPREISCANPEALLAIYGPTGAAAKAIRGPWYCAQSKMPNIYSLQNEPTIPDHNKRRRDWDPAFSTKAIAGYRENITRNADRLIKCVEILAQKGDVDVKECMMWFGFDVMGELGFGRSFETLDAGKTSNEVHLVELGVRVINTIGVVPYLSYLVRYLPSPLQPFELWLNQAVDWRISKQGQREFVDTDVFAYLLGETGRQNRKLNRDELVQDCMLMVVAGSDTTSNAMSFCLYELARQPQLIAQLRKELEAHFPSGTKPDNFEILREDCRLLNACLQETLRLWPPVPSGLQREMTQPIKFPNGPLLSAGTVLSTHCFTMHRDNRYFYEAERFIPERWIQEPNTAKQEVHNAKAWAPFGYGTTSCIGKNLAFMEMRLVLAQFVQRFDFSIDPAEAQVFCDSVRDQFVVSADKLIMHVKARH